MAYAFVQDIAASWKQYERVASGLNCPTPHGLILHLAGPTDEGFRIIAAWNSEQAWKHFQTERLQPAIATLGGPARPEPTFRDLHATHLVLGSIDANSNLATTRPTAQPTVSPTPAGTRTEQP
jgi:hypothetical protein